MKSVTEDNSLKTNFKDKVYIYGIVVKCTMVAGKTPKCTDMENLSGQMELYIEVNIKMV